MGNRFCLVNATTKADPAFLQFSELEFYVAPVLLETVGDNHLLGAAIDPKQRTVIVQLPQKAHMIIPPQAAGSSNFKLSGLRSRIAIIRQVTFPKELIPDQLNQLRTLYVSAGYSNSELEMYFPKSK